MAKPKMKEFLKAMGRMQDEDFVTTEEFYKIFDQVMTAIQKAAVINKEQMGELSRSAEREAKKLEKHFEELFTAVQERMDKVEDGKPGRDGETPIAGIDYPSYQEIREFITDAVAEMPSVEELEERMRGMMSIDEVKRGLEALEGNDRLSFEAINGIEQFIDESVRKMGAELRRGPMAITGGGTGSSGGSTTITDQNGTAWRVFYSDGSGDVTELALGADGTFLKSNGASAAPSWATAAGSGDVSKVGTPVDGQIGVWTGDGTIEGDAALTFDTTTDSLVIAASGNLLFGAVTVLDDNAGTMTLSNIDALDATTETTIENAIDTLPNLTSATSLSITESQISDLGSYLTSVAINDVSDVTITTPADNEVLAYNSGTGTWINQTAAEASLATSAQGALADSALQNVVEDTTPQLGGNLDTNGNDITMLDNDILYIGTGQDLWLSHNATNSKIVSGTGNLVIDNTNVTGKTQLQLGTDTSATGVEILNNSSTVLFSVDADGTVTLPTGTTGVLRADSGVVSTDSDVTDIVTAASTTTAGKVELATTAETNTGNDTGRAVTPDGLAGSNFGIKYVAVSLNGSTALTTSDAEYFRVPAAYTGMNLVSVAATVGTGSAGSSSSGTPTFVITNVTDGVSMLSTNLTVDVSEYTSATAATAAVINTATDDVVTDDLISVTVTTAGTGVTYATVTLGFQLP